MSSLSWPKLCLSKTGTRFCYVYPLNRDIASCLRKYLLLHKQMPPEMHFLPKQTEHWFLLLSSPLLLLALAPTFSTISHSFTYYYDCVLSTKLASSRARNPASSRNNKTSPSFVTCELLLMRRCCLILYPLLECELFRSLLLLQPPLIVAAIAITFI